MTKPKPKSKERPKHVEFRAYANLAPGAKDARLGGDKDRVPGTVAGHIGQAQQLAGDSYIEVADKRTYFERNDPFALSLWLRIDRKAARPITSGARASGTVTGGVSLLLTAPTNALHSCR